VAEKLGITLDDVKHLQPLPKQVLTEEDQHRLQNLGRNGDRIDPTVWGQWTSSVKNYKASADEVLSGRLPAGGMMEKNAAE
jgi:catalase